jgi:hypothetical protein
VRGAGITAAAALASSGPVSRLARGTAAVARAVAAAGAGAGGGSGHSGTPTGSAAGADGGGVRWVGTAGTGSGWLSRHGWANAAHGESAAVRGPYRPGVRVGTAGGGLVGAAGGWTTAGCATAGPAPLDPPPLG